MNRMWDVIVVGGGAAGLLAAQHASLRGRATLLLEKNNKLGVKILMSGGTRCNITHDCSVREIAKAFGPSGRFLLTALHEFPPDEVVRRLADSGVPTKVEPTGKIFPISDRAIDVRDALVQMARSSGSELGSGTPVVQCQQLNDGAGFQVSTESNAFRSRSLIITTGGKSFPGCGTTGDGYVWAEQFGHTVTRLAAGLTPVVSHVPWANSLKGISVEPVNCSMACHDNRIVASSLQPVLFTHFGFSGPGPMNVSRLANLHPEEKFRLQIDFLPHMNFEQVVAQFRCAASESGSGPVDKLLPSCMSRRLRDSFLASIDFDRHRTLAELSTRQLRHLATSLKCREFPVHGTRGFAKAEVTCGGVDLREVDGRTMESKRVRGLYFAGEILDLDGPIGGFNFQSAFSTGWLAGAHA